MGMEVCGWPGKKWTRARPGAEDKGVSVSITGAQSYGYSIQLYRLSHPCAQEDEIAVNAMTAGQNSPYMSLVFMTREPEYRPFFSFKNAPAAARKRWTQAFLFFLRKLTLRARVRRC